MYTAVLMLAMTTSVETIDHGGRRGGGCNGGYGGCSGYYGGGYGGGCFRGGHHGGGYCHGGYGGGCSGGYYGGHHGGYGGYCSGGYYGGGGCFGSGYFGATSYGQQYWGGTIISGPVYAQSTNAPATILVNIPADARLMVDGNATKSTGESRSLVTPPLENGSSYVYTLRAEMNVNGQTRTETREVTVRPGQTTSVQFNLSSQGVASQ